jgi:hypothetical protein
VGRDKIDVRKVAAGERIVFLPCTLQTFKRAQNWIHSRSIFDEDPAQVDYAASVAI